ncbi:MAG TPA: class I SAM-dependent methyltransferase [Gaiellaceae bacterium]|nr:class I SAM-dependent methyltransferase [Gaiellaceae bacterium]
MSDPRVEIVARGYDRIADRFAGWRDEIVGDPRREWAEDLASRLAPGVRVLELGCGAASAETVMLAERFQLTGIDVSDEQIRRARERLPDAEFVHADFLEVELPEASFDAVCSFYVLNHVPREHLGALLGRIAAWLRPGGLAVNAFGVGDNAGWTGDWLGAEMFFAGFEPAENTRLVEAAGLGILRDEIVSFDEPEGSVEFQWILARR